MCTASIDEVFGILSTSTDSLLTEGGEIDLAGCLHKVMLALRSSNIRSQISHVLSPCDDLLLILEQIYLVADAKQIIKELKQQILRDLAVAIEANQTLLCRLTALRSFLLRIALVNVALQSLTPESLSYSDKLEEDIIYALVKLPYMLQRSLTVPSLERQDFCDIGMPLARLKRFRIISGSVERAMVLDLMVHRAAHQMESSDLERFLMVAEEDLSSTLVATDHLMQLALTIQFNGSGRIYDLLAQMFKSLVLSPSRNASGGESTLLRNLVAGSLSQIVGAADRMTPDLKPEHFARVIVYRDKLGRTVHMLEHDIGDKSQEIHDTITSATDNMERLYAIDREFLDGHESAGDESIKLMGKLVVESDNHPEVCDHMIKLYRGVMEGAGDRKALIESVNEALDAPGSPLETRLRAAESIVETGDFDAEVRALAIELFTSRLVEASNKLRKSNLPSLKKYFGINFTTAPPALINKNTDALTRLVKDLLQRPKQYTITFPPLWVVERLLELRTKSPERDALLRWVSANLPLVWSSDALYAPLLRIFESTAQWVATQRVDTCADGECLFLTKSFKPIFTGLLVSPEISIIQQVTDFYAVLLEQLKHVSPPASFASVVEDLVKAVERAFVDVFHANRLLDAAKRSLFTLSQEMSSDDPSDPSELDCPDRLKALASEFYKYPLGRKIHEKITMELTDDLGQFYKNPAACGDLHLMYDSVLEAIVNQEADPKKVSSVVDSVVQAMGHQHDIRRQVYVLRTTLRHHDVFFDGLLGSMESEKLQNVDRVIELMTAINEALGKAKQVTLIEMLNPANFALLSDNELVNFIEALESVQDGLAHFLKNHPTARFFAPIWVANQAIFVREGHVARRLLTWLNLYSDGRFLDDVELSPVLAQAELFCRVDCAKAAELLQSVYVSLILSMPPEHLVEKFIKAIAAVEKAAVQHDDNLLECRLHRTRNAAFVMRYDLTAEGTKGYADYNPDELQKVEAALLSTTRPKC